jgi:hypothetical protein
MLSSHLGLEISLKQSKSTKYLIGFLRHCRCQSRASRAPSQLDQQTRSVMIQAGQVEEGHIYAKAEHDLDAIDVNVL